MRLALAIGVFFSAATICAQDTLPGKGLAQHPFLYCGDGKAIGAAAPIQPPQPDAAAKSP